MRRVEFLKTCGLACSGGFFLTSVLEGCGNSTFITGTIDHSDLVVPLSVFQRDENAFRRYVVVQHESLKYPVCVYRLSNTEYSALWMCCTHQGTELEIFGDRLECPAHGSRFSDTGKVENGPASTDLRTFPVAVSDNQIHISLK